MTNRLFDPDEPPAAPGAPAPADTAECGVRSAGCPLGDGIADPNARHATGDTPGGEPSPVEDEFEDASECGVRNAECGIADPNAEVPTPNPEPRTTQRAPDAEVPTPNAQSPMPSTVDPLLYGCGQTGRIVAVEGDGH